MATSIKSPAGDVIGKGKDGKSKGPGVWNGEPGYAPRTSSPNAMPEKTYDGVKPNAGSPSMKTPTGPARPGKG